MHALLYSHGIVLILTDARVVAHGYALYDRLRTLVIPPDLPEDEEVQLLDVVLEHWLAIRQRPHAPAHPGDRPERN